MDSFKKFSENKLPDKCKIFGSLKDECISEKDNLTLLMFGMCLKLIQWVIMMIFI